LRQSIAPTLINATYQASREISRVAGRLGYNLLMVNVPSLFRVGLLSVCLVAVAACSQTDDAWETAVNTDTPDAYATFLERYPKSEHADKARARRDALIDQRDWSVARRENTADAYSKYLSVHPEGVWSKLAISRRDALTTVETPPPVAIVEPTLPTEKHFLQLGAFSSAPSAEKGWTFLQRSFVELANLSPVIDATPLRGSSLYRLRVQVDSEEEADRICAALLRGGEQCVKSE
jgi:hypothetical protein